MLDANFNYYTDGDVDKLRTLSYSIPEDLTQDIDLLSPTVFFSRTRAIRAMGTHKSKRRSTSTMSSHASSVSVAASCQTSITPSCLKQMYNVGNYTPSAKNSRIGFGSFLNQSALYADLESYEKYYGIPSQNFTKVIIANALNSQSPADENYGEADLDVQNIIGLSHPIPVTEFLTGGLP